MSDFIWVLIIGALIYCSYLFYQGRNATKTGQRRSGLAESFKQRLPWQDPNHPNQAAHAVTEAIVKEVVPDFGGRPTYGRLTIYLQLPQRLYNLYRSTREQADYLGYKVQESLPRATSHAKTWVKDDQKIGGSFTIEPVVGESIQAAAVPQGDPNPFASLARHETAGRLDPFGEGFAGSATTSHQDEVATAPGTNVGEVTTQPYSPADNEQIHTQPPVSKGLRATVRVGGETRSVTAHYGSFALGRGERNAVKLPNLREGGISRKHATISRMGTSKIAFCDESQHGSLLNGNRVEPRQEVIESLPVEIAFSDAREVVIKIEDLVGLVGHWDASLDTRRMSE